MAKAARAGDSDVVKALLAVSIEKNKENELASLPLKIAAENGYLEVVRILLGVSINFDKAGNDWANTPVCSS